ncbi:MAG TPA: histidine kinase dimerization/phosphoacceptor domain -containing protein [Devosiaceae bacterium]|jgi:two-component sensor histidine kinase|nr:histidine kinase dimerization/phosphoacceptor domain -containing protein [Devosiaceae bacterium]
MTAVALVSQRRRVRLVWTATFLASIAIAIALLVLGSLMEERVRVSLHARSIISDFYHAMTQAEKAQRAYLLTEDTDYIADYRLARSRIEALGRDLQNIVSVRVLQPEEIGEVLRLTEERSAQLEKALAAFDTDGLAAAMAVMRNNELRQTTARIHDLVDRIDDEEDGVIAGGQEAVEKTRALLLAALVVLLAGTVAASAQSIRGERRVAEELAELNRSLENKVEARTRELEQERRRVQHLLSELSHRIGNNLALLSSTLLLRARSTDDEVVRSALEEASERIVTMAVAQRRLHAESSTGMVNIRSYLELIMDDLRRMAPADGVSLHLEADPLQMPADDAVAVGVLVNELVTNALKHAFPDGKGELQVLLAAKGEEIALDVTDDGRGIQGASGQNVGTMIVQSMVNALQGRAISASPAMGEPGGGTGTAWRIRFPAPDSRPSNNVERLPSR